MLPGRTWSGFSSSLSPQPDQVQLEAARQLATETAQARADAHAELLRAEQIWASVATGVNAGKYGVDNQVRVRMHQIKMGIQVKWVEDSTTWEDPELPSFHLCYEGTTFESRPNLEDVGGGDHQLLGLLRSKWDEVENSPSRAARRTALKAQAAQKLSDEQIKVKFEHVKIPGGDADAWLQVCCRPLRNAKQPRPRDSRSLSRAGARRPLGPLVWVALRGSSVKVFNERQKGSAGGAHLDCPPYARPCPRSHCLHACSWREKHSRPLLSTVRGHSDTSIDHIACMFVCMRLRGWPSRENALRARVLSRGEFGRVRTLGRCNVSGAVLLH